MLCPQGDNQDAGNFQSHRHIFYHPFNQVHQELLRDIRPRGRRPTSFDTT